MASLGQRLREAREQQGLRLEQIEVSTRIRRSYLVAMEAEDYASLPHPTYVKGFLKSYASTLGLDPAEILDLYPLRESRPTLAPVAKLDKPGLGAGFWVGLLLVVLVLGGLGGVLYVSPTLPAILPTTFQTGTPESPAREVQPTIAPVKAAPTVLARSAPPPVQATQPPTPTPAPEGVEVRARATANTWVWAIVDSTPVYTGTMRPGEEQNWVARDKVFMRIGNAGGLIITHNGQQRGTLGTPGQVMDVQWTRDSMSFDANPPLPGPR